MPKVPISHVADDEILYRRILNGMGLYEIQADGTVLFDSQAFAERSCRPSVYRAKLCNNDPNKALAGFSGGVTSLVAGDVRSIDDLVQYDKDERPIRKFIVDIEHKPIFDDP